MSALVKRQTSLDCHTAYGELINTLALTRHLQAANWRASVGSSVFRYGWARSEPSGFPSWGPRLAPAMGYYFPRCTSIESLRGGEWCESGTREGLREVSRVEASLLPTGHVCANDAGGRALREERGGPPNVSVGDPVYGQGAFPKETLASLLNQDWPPLEPVVSNSHSAVSTSLVLEEFGNRTLNPRARNRSDATRRARIPGRHGRRASCSNAP